MFSLQYVQLWWTTTGPLIAFFPWVLLACLIPMPAWLRIPVLVWITATFLLAEFYVITIASLVFAGGFAVAGAASRTSCAFRMSSYALPAARSDSAWRCSICGGRSRSWPTRSIRGTATRSPAGSCRGPGCWPICSRTSSPRDGNRSTGTIWRSRPAAPTRCCSRRCSSMSIGCARSSRRARTRIARHAGRSRCLVPESW